MAGRSSEINGALTELMGGLLMWVVHDSRMSLQSGPSAELSQGHELSVRAGGRAQTIL